MTVDLVDGWCPRYLFNSKYVPGIVQTLKPVWTFPLLELMV